MRWVRYRHNGSEHTARAEDGHIIPVAAQSPLQAALGQAVDDGDPVALDQVELLAPVVPIRNVFCVGWNYLPHFEEGEIVHGTRPLPERPNIFTKATETVIGPYDPISSHSAFTNKLDWEVELAAVIGRRCVNLSEDSALDSVAGYMVAQDVSARDIQHGHGGQWFRGKSLDGTCPTGPWLVDAADIGDPQSLEISCSVDGVVKQSSNTAAMIFPIASILAELSRGLTLLPGDIILTGTPEGVGQSRTPPEFLHPGSVLESTIEHIGTLRNIVM